MISTYTLNSDVFILCLARTYIHIIKYIDAKAVFSLFLSWSAIIVKFSKYRIEIFATFVNLRSRLIFLAILVYIIEINIK